MTRWAYEINQIMNFDNAHGLGLTENTIIVPTHTTERSWSDTEENIFTAHNTFTEAGIIEHMAQTIALHSGYKNKDEQGDVPIGFIGAIKKVEVFTLPKVTDVLTTTATIVTEFMGITLVKLRCMRDDKLIAECEMKTAIANA